MASEARAGERAYREIKQAILSGELRQRQRLDIDDLGRRWRVSATPVRQALAILGAERLVSSRAGRGYHVAFWSERELWALYEWRWQLARLSFESFPAVPEATPVGDNHVERLLALWRGLDEAAHEELRRAAIAADERLRAAYRVEPEVLAQTGRELTLLGEALASGSSRRGLQRLRIFFRRRIAACAVIRARAAVRALPRNGE